MISKRFLFFLLLAGLTACLANSETPPEPFSPSNRPVGLIAAPQQPILDCDSSYMRGDFNRSGTRDLRDVMTLLNCVFVYQTPAVCLVCVGDLNCDQRLSPVDAVIMLRLYSFESTVDIKCGPVVED